MKMNPGRPAMVGVLLLGLMVTSGPGWAHPEGSPVLGGAAGSAVQTAPDVGTQIRDAATLKLLMLDLLGRLGAFDFGSREGFGWASETVARDTARKVAAKYGITLKGNFVPDTGFTVEDDGPTAMTHVRLPNTWTGLMTLPESGRLPSVKFRSGQISMSLKTLAVRFANGTECMIGNREYTVLDGKWSRKQGGGGNPQ